MAAKKTPSEKPPASKRSKKTEPELRVVGDVVMRALSTVRPNPWNPNEMTKFERKALAYGLKKGWYKAQSLLIWGTDEKGKPRNLIIDGEQRWTVATEIGFVEGPMVVLDGLSEKRAREITIEFMNKRGTANREKLVENIKWLDYRDDDIPNAALDLGIVPMQLEKILDVNPVEAHGRAGASRLGGGLTYQVLVQVGDEDEQARLAKK